MSRFSGKKSPRSRIKKSPRPRSTTGGKLKFGVTARHASGEPDRSISENAMVDARLNEVAKHVSLIKFGQRDIVTPEAKLSGWVCCKFTGGPNSSSGQYVVKYGEVLATAMLKLFDVKLRHILHVTEKFAIAPEKDDVVPEGIPPSHTVVCVAGSQETNQAVRVVMRHRDYNSYCGALDALRSGDAERNPIARLVFGYLLQNVGYCHVLMRLSNETLEIWSVTGAKSYSLTNCIVEAAEVDTNTAGAAAVEQPEAHLVTTAPLSLESTSSPIDKCQHGLRIIMASDRHLVMATRNPFLVLQWIGALKAAQKVLRDRSKRQVLGRGSRGSLRVRMRSKRSGSSAMMDQLFASATGGRPPSNSFADILEQRKSTSITGEQLNVMFSEARLPIGRTVKEVLDDPKLRKVFISFCRSIFEPEKVLFLLACRRFRERNNSKSVATEIYNEFVVLSGKSSLSLPPPLRKVDISGEMLDAGVFAKIERHVTNKLQAEQLAEFFRVVEEAQGGTGVYIDEDSSVSSSSSELPERSRSDSMSDLFGGAGPIISQQKMDEIRENVARSIAFDPDDPPPFKRLMAKKVTRSLLAEFSKTLLAEENVIFWEQVQRFKVATGKSRVELLESIFDQFIKGGNSSSLNIGGKERKVMNDALRMHGATVLAMDHDDIFDNALLEVEKVMELDVYVKFINLAKSTTHLRQQTKSSKKQQQDPPRPCPSLNDILNNVEELHNLLVFSVSINAPNELLFWALVESYKGEQDAAMRAKMAKHLLGEYVSTGAPKALAIADDLKAAVHYQCTVEKGELTLDCFESLQRACERRMLKHVYKKYQREWKKMHGKRKKKRKKKKGINRVSGQLMLQQELSAAAKLELSPESSKRVDARTSAAANRSEPAADGGSHHKRAWSRPILPDFAERVSPASSLESESSLASAGGSYDEEKAGTHFDDIY